MIFCKTIFSQQEIISVYDTLYNQSNSHYQRHSKVEFDKLLEGNRVKVGYDRSKIIKKNVFNKRCKSVLEIGSGVGLIGYYIGYQDNKIRYTGIELDKEAFEKSQILKLNTIHGDFAIIGNLNENFDVIMLWEVIEHLQDLNLFLELAFKKLNENGKIILSTPNYNKIHNYPKREKDQIFQDQPPIHLNFFTKENIKNIFEKHQYSNCKVLVKKLPYLQLKSLGFYIDCIKVFFNKYQGTTLYFEATKK
ncbi:class I SAM-dependent methyltransferase [Flavobacterium sp.]|uniref:class I SAM-dependent methyltransferase n=1 Tax=Flavobacterium sp. TaxID=239 RepID=UPI00286CDF18|nr:class I SAM-dependent methyltransferase [Flavobacterium sp.]